jgi:hypothetical protein
MCFRTHILPITPVHENSITTNGLPGNNVTTAVADHVALAKVDIPLFCRFKKHPGFRLTTRAIFTLSVRANLDIVHLQALFETLVHGFDYNAVYEPITDVRLVGNNDDQEIGALERLHGMLHPWQQPKIFNPARRIGLAVANFAAVNHAVAIKKNRTTLFDNIP